MCPIWCVKSVQEIVCCYRWLYSGKWSRQHLRWLMYVLWCHCFRVDPTYRSLLYLQVCSNRRLGVCPPMSVSQSPCMFCVNIGTATGTYLVWFWRNSETELLVVSYRMFLLFTILNLQRCQFLQCWSSNCLSFKFRQMFHTDVAAISPGAGHMI